MRLAKLVEIGAAIKSHDLLATQKRSSAMIDQLQALIPWKRSLRRTMSPQLRFQIKHATAYIIKNANDGYSAFDSSFLKFFDSLVGRRILREAGPAFTKEVKDSLGKEFDFDTDIFTGLDGKRMKVEQIVYFFQSLRLGS